MLDDPEKTARLLAALNAALPFEIELTPEALALLRAQEATADIQPKQTVSKVSYSGDAGGILCHLRAEGTENAVIISLTHVRMRSPLPLAAAVFDYQKHRAKKLKKFAKL
jgi:hypothetical protein